jgi:hypothetical protein
MSKLFGKKNEASTNNMPITYEELNCCNVDSDWIVSTIESRDPGFLKWKIQEINCIY